MQIADILNSQKNWVLKWSVHSAKEKLNKKVAGKPKVIFKFIENYLKLSTY